MSVGIEALFTSALGLIAPWEVDKVDLDTARRRIDFAVRCPAKLLACPHRGVANQRIHDRLRRSWRHLDFFQFEAWLHADMPRVACTGFGNRATGSRATRRQRATGSGLNFKVTVGGELNFYPLAPPPSASALNNTGWRLGPDGDSVRPTPPATSVAQPTKGLRSRSTTPRRARSVG